MELGGFASIFELMAAINIAFVAVEYAKNYTNILAKSVFRLQDTIDKKFGELVVIFSQRESLDTITGIDFNKVEAIGKIEKCKRNSEKLKEEINDVKNQLKNSVEYKCEFRNFSNQCLWAFLYAVVALFVAGLEKCSYKDNFIACLTFLSVFTLIYFIIGWIFGESNKSFFQKQFSKLLFVIISFATTLVISIIICLLCSNISLLITCYKNWLIPFFAAIPFLNFIIYFIVSITRIQRIKSEMHQRSEALNQKCLDWGKEADTIITAHSFYTSLSQTGIEDIE